MRIPMGEYEPLEEEVPMGPDFHPVERPKMTVKQYGLWMGMGERCLNHHARIFDYTTENGFEPEKNGKEAIAAYLAAPENMTDHASYLRQALVQAHYLDADEEDAGKVAALCAELHGGWMMLANCAVAMAGQRRAEAARPKPTSAQLEAWRAEVRARMGEVV